MQNQQVEGADVITDKSTSVNLYNPFGGFIANIPVANIMRTPKVILWDEKVFSATEVVCTKEDKRKAGERKIGSYPIPIPYRIEYREVTFYKVPEQSAEYIAPPAFAADVLPIAKTQGEKKADQKLNEIIRDNQTPCPECGVGYGLHKRGCLAYQLELNEMSEKHQKLFKGE